MRSYLLPLLLVMTLSCSPIRMYQQLPNVKYWENDILKFEQLDSSETYPENAVLFAGSSSIRLWSTLAQDMDPYPAIQRGYGGAKLSDLAVYAERIFYPHRCRAIVMFVANDITGSKEDISPDEVARLFCSVLKTIRKKFPDTPVFWTATTPTPLRWNVWPGIVNANKLIQDVCERMDHTYFIKTDFAFLNANGEPNDELFLTDRLHLNAQGYVVWAEIIRKELDRVLAE